MPGRTCCAPGKRLCPCVQSSLQEGKPKDVQPQMDAVPFRKNKGPNKLQDVHKSLQSHLCHIGSAVIYGTEARQEA